MIEKKSGKGIKGITISNNKIKQNKTIEWQTENK